MKKILFISLFIGNCMCSQAQEIYNRIYESAIQVTSNPESPESEVKLNHFYVTALNYLKSESSEQMKEVTTTFLDTQAYYLSEFVTSFFKDLSQARQMSAESQQKVVIAYINATLNTPLFKDKETEKTHAFVNEKESLTPFSLNTDWEKAYKKATKRAAKILK